MLYLVAIYAHQLPPLGGSKPFVNVSTFLHIKNENIILVAVTSGSNPNACLIFEFLHKIVKLGESYFKTLNEESVKNNFALIYDLFDEICDFGFPQTTDADMLKMYISTDGILQDKGATEKEVSKIAIQTTGAVSWRRADIKYRKNEAFVDIVESVNLIVSPKGTVLKSDVSGQVLMRAYLSGMPECKFGLNDKLMMEKQGTGVKMNSNVALDDCQFHQCVKLGKFDAERTINFIPPDGEFELMKYRSTDNISLPFKVRAVVDEVTASKVEFRISVKSNYPSKIYAQNIVIKIPTPLNTASTKISVQGGKAKYVGSENCFVWKIAKFQGGEEIFFTAESELTESATNKSWSRPPISLDFQVIMFAASGLVVRFLKIFEKSNYQSVKWVRYMTKAGSYNIRI